MTAEVDLDEVARKEAAFRELVGDNALPGRYRDRDGNEIEWPRWMALFSTRGYQQVALETIDKVVVSTVWLGTERGLFETMVFADEGSPIDGETHKHPDETTAIRTHDEIVDRIRTRLGAH